MKLGILCCGFMCCVIVCVEHCITSAQDGVPPRPTFPDVFQVEVQGIFKDKLAEADCVIYYDRENNRAALFIDYQNDTSKLFYFFDDNEIVQIQGNVCSLDTIPEDSDLSFFPFIIDEDTKQKKIAPPEDILRFSNSVYDGEELAVFPSYIYKSTIDVPQYHRKNCDVTHIFSKPEIEIATCEGHACKPTIVAISVHCPGGKEEDIVDHVYDFYRFRPGISDQRIFQTPPGLHCPRKNKKLLPPPPNYFSFSYDLIEKQVNVDADGATMILHKKVWFDGIENLVRTDEYDDNGLLTTVKIFDYQNDAAYTILTISSDCSMGPMQHDLALDVITRLPSAIFPQKSSKSQEETVYVGKRQLHGLDYDVWSLFSKIDDDALQVVKEIFFTKFVPNAQEVVNQSSLQLSYAEFFSYSENDDLSLELIMTTYIAINNYRTFPRELSVFNIASCFTDDQKKAIEIKISGPDFMKNSVTHAKLLFLLHKKLVTTSGVSVIRISDINSIFDTNGKLTAFRGLILQNPMSLGIGNANTEPDINAVYNLLETEIKKGKITIDFKNDNGEAVRYTVDSISEIKEEVKPVKKQEDKYGYTSGSLAAASCIMLLLGILFGTVGCYVFQKRSKRPATVKFVNS